MDDLISRKTAIDHMKVMADCAKCDHYNHVRCRACSWNDAMNIVDEMPAVDAIPVEWIEWRIAHAEREGFGEVVSMLRMVRDWWNDQRDVWQKEQEMDNNAAD